MSRPHISVIVPTYQRAALLRACIRSFDRAEAAPSFEVVVVDDGSTDTTAHVLAELAAQRPWLRWSSQPANHGPAAARNAALARAEADLVLFVDDDIVASPTLLRQHADLHAAAADEQLAIVGRVDWHPALKVTPFMRWLDRSGLQFGYGSWLREGRVDLPASAFYTANLSMSRSLVNEVGGFNERFPYPAFEDVELATRLTKAGLRLDYRPQALAYHARSVDLPTFRRRMENAGEASVLMEQIAHDFTIDDRNLKDHLRSGGQNLRVLLKALTWRSERSRGTYYWSVMASAYERGRQRAAGA